MKQPKSLRMLALVIILLITMTSMFLSGFSHVILWMLHIFPSTRTASLALPLIFLGVAFVLDMLISAIVSKRVLKPLRSLIAATKAIASGDFSVRVEDNGNLGEFGDLIRSFNTMAEELGSIEIFRSDFINTFSHEFKTPIVSIRGFARQLSSGDLSKEMQAEYADIIVSESERLVNMSSNILLLTKLENQQIIPNVKPYSLDEQLRDSILVLERFWNSKKIEWTIDLEPITYLGNADMMQHIWINLISNAVKFSPDGSTISVLAKSSENSITVTVADNGIGMDADTSQRIFEKFYQGDSSHTTAGNGLGLSVAKRITELCGGSITVESAPNKGSVFCVILPLCKN